MAIFQQTKKSLRLSHQCRRPRTKALFCSVHLNASRAEVDLVLVVWQRRLPGSRVRLDAEGYRRDHVLDAVRCREEGCGR